MNTVNNFNSFPKLFGDVFDQFFNTNISDVVGADFSWSNPSVNVIEHDDHFAIELAAPGLKKEDFNIAVDQDQLKISSDVKNQNEGGHENAKFIRREFQYKSFVRSFTLPKTIDRDSISAQYTDGILAIKVKKLETAIDRGPKQISID